MEKIKFVKKYKQYPEMVDSGVEWIGKIPKDWKERKLKDFVELLTGWTPDSKNSLFYEGKNKWVTIGDMQGKFIKDTNQNISDLAINKFKMKMLEKGTLLYSFKLSVGKVAFLSENMYTNEAIVAFKIKHKRTTSSFLYYPLYSYFLENARENIYGAKMLNKSLMLNSSIVLPTLNVQEKILEFLDLRISKIDRIVKLKERLIELLKEKREAIINQAVTKGLDPNAEMVDSGVEWIGKIPKGWEIKRLKYVSKLNYGESLEESRREDGIYPIYGSNGIVGYHNKKITNGPTIIIGRKGSFGQVRFSETPCFPIDTTFYIEESEGFLLVWFYFLIMNMNLDKISFDTGVPGLNRDFVLNKLIPIPDYNLQKKLSEYLKEYYNYTVQLEIKIIKSIELFKEYKQSLITNIVTGKVEV